MIRPTLTSAWDDDRRELIDLPDWDKLKVGVIEKSEFPVRPTFLDTHWFRIILPTWMRPGNFVHRHMIWRPANHSRLFNDALIGRLIAVESPAVLYFDNEADATLCGQFLKEALSEVMNAGGDEHWTSLVSFHALATTFKRMAN